MSFLYHLPSLCFSTPLHNLTPNLISVMSALYSLWDIIEDLVVRKVNESDATKFSKLCCGPPQMWGGIWFFISLIFVGVAIVAALIVFKDDGVGNPTLAFGDSR